MSFQQISQEKPQNSSSPPNTPWWSRTNKGGLDDRIRRIQTVNDPTSSADEMLRWSKIIMVVLLTFTGALGALSYFRFFGMSFHPYLAAALAITLTGVIEWGKNKASLWVLRIPFFQGWRHISAEVHNSLIWIGLLLIAALTFGMSAYNSTQGAKQVSLLLSHEKNHRPYAPNTSELDAQIAATQQTITNAPTVTRKGKRYYQSKETVSSAQRTVENLQGQRQASMAAQRTDWEAQNSRQQQQGQYGAGMVLAAGGWVEALQLIFLLLRVSCERALDKKQAAPEESRRIGFRSSPTPDMAAAIGTKPIGYNVDPAGNVMAATSGYRLRRDTIGSQPGVATTTEAQPPTLAAFKMHRQDVSRANANLRTRNGLPSTICKRLESTFEGLIQHFPASDDAQRWALKECLLEWQGHYADIMREYFPEAHVKDTPIAGAKHLFTKVFALVEHQTKPTRV
jgi:hypothetical protein